MMKKLILLIFLGFCSFGFIWPKKVLAYSGCSGATDQCCFVFSQNGTTYEIGGNGNLNGDGDRIPLTTDGAVSVQIQVKKVKNPTAYRLIRGTQEDGVQEVPNTNIPRSDPPKTTFSHTFLPIKETLDGSPVSDPLIYKLAIREDKDGIFGNPDQTICSVYLVVSNTTDSSKALCCPQKDENADGEIDTPEYDLKEGECVYKKYKSRDSGTVKHRPQSCFIDSETGKWVMGNNYFTPICEQAGPQSDNCIDCQNEDGLWTAIGCIKLDIKEMVKQFITFAVSIAGGIAMLLILYGGFTISSSAGNPQKVQEGREIITAAISGLVFIILSVAILQFIGVSIIHIPGIH